MAVEHSYGKLVTSGLVLYLNAADANSYPGTGTTWSDLSGNNRNGTLVNGPSFNSSNGGSIVFDGVDDNVTTTFNPALTDFTIGIWFRQSGTVINYQRLIDSNYITGTWIGRNSNTPNSWGGGVRDTIAPFGRFITLTDGQWHYIVSRRQGTTHTILGDGITNTASGTVSSTALNTNNITIGRSDQSPSFDYMSGNIAQVSIYNRALTDAEILQNYNATKTRFGLT